VLTSSDFRDLVDQIKNRDDGAMCRLVKVYGPTMERIAAKLVGQTLQAQLDPADAVQNVHVTLWVGIRSGRFDVPTPEHFLALAKTLLRRHVARYWRKVKLEMMSTMDGRLMETLPDQDLSAVLQEAEKEKRLEVDEILERFLCQVDSIDQQLIKMRFHGYSTADAARALKLDPRFLRVRLSRLRLRFANLWPQLASAD
jgi:RNA polymerase sigma factor (sigma-70 family)